MFLQTSGLHQLRTRTGRAESMASSRMGGNPFPIVASPRKILRTLMFRHPPECPPIGSTTSRQSRVPRCSDVTTCDVHERRKAGASRRPINPRRWPSSTTGTALVRRHTRVAFWLCRPVAGRRSQRFVFSAKNPCPMGTRCCGWRTRTTFSSRRSMPSDPSRVDQTPPLRLPRSRNPAPSLTFASFRRRPVTSP